MYVCYIYRDGIFPSNVIMAELLPLTDPQIILSDRCFLQCHKPDVIEEAEVYFCAPADLPQLILETLKDLFSVILPAEKLQSSVCMFVYVYVCFFFLPACDRKDSFRRSLR